MLNRLSKVLDINRMTSIETKATIGEVEDDLVNGNEPPDIKQLNECFRANGIPLAVKACLKAIEEWGGKPESITHIVSTTCTNSANPGFDHYVAKALKIDRNVEKVLLHGIGCSGGLAAIRTACNLALGSTYQERPARVLVVSCEISSSMVRSELDSIDKDQSVRIGVCLFSDCASACVLSNGIGEEIPDKLPVFNLLEWKNETIQETDRDLGFDVDPLGEHITLHRFTLTDGTVGWKVVLTRRVPDIVTKALLPAFRELKDPLMAESTPSDFDWALHPGGITVLKKAYDILQLSEECLRASYEIYTKYGNSSSATILSVMDRLRHIGGGRRNVIACAFGPGINLEMMLLQRPALSYS